MHLADTKTRFDLFRPSNGVPLPFPERSMCSQFKIFWVAHAFRITLPGHRFCAKSLYVISDSDCEGGGPC